MSYCILHIYFIFHITYAVKIWARVGVPGEGGGGDEAMNTDIDSNVIDEFKYIPSARIEKETENVKRKRKAEEV
jgi:hypothetical protein